MALYPYVISPWFEQRFFLEDGSPNAGGFVYTKLAGTSTDQDTYTTANGTPHENPIELDADGRPPSPIFIAPVGMKFLVHDADDVLLYTVDLVEDAGSVFAQTWGTLLSAGSKNVVSGYTVLAADRLVTVDSSAGATTINLLAAGDATQPVVIKNLGANTVTLTPDGTDTIDTLSSFTLSAASSPTFPELRLVSDGVSSWWIIGR
jgi:hypothetical protein